jgi:hypothetical protein
MMKMLVVGVHMVNTTKDHTKQVLNATGMRKKKMLVVDVYTVNTTKGRTKQVLNTTGMRQKKMLVLPLIGQF